MDTRIYGYLLAVAEYKNLSEAAKACFISQPALTQHIKRLEESFGCSLFIYQQGEWKPTRQGEICLTTARRMLQIEKETYEKIEVCRKTFHSSLRVFVDFHLRNVFIEKIYPCFKERFPNVELTLLSGDTSSAAECFSHHFTDLGIFPISQPLHASIGSITVDQSEYLMILPPKHRCAEEFQKYGIDFQKIKNERFLLNQPFSLFSVMQHQILERHGISPETVLYSHSMQSIARMVQNGMGISFLPDFIIEMTGDSCVSLPLDPPWKFWTILAYPKSKGLTEYGEFLAELWIRHYRQFH